MFIGREKELKELHDCFNKNSLQPILIYGKRRIGKTELIKKAISETNNAISINYQCTRTTYKDNIDKLNQLACTALKKDLLKLDSIEEILGFLSKESKEKKIILCLDEYPYLKDLKPGIDDIFQSFIDSNNNANIKIIFCGSYANIMENLIAKNAALFGRFKKVISLKEIPYYDAFKLCPSNYLSEDKIRIYSIFGGVPYYYTFLEQDLTFEENIIKNVINNSSLMSEAENCLNSQLSKINSANSIFQAIASGKKNFSDIKNEIGITNPNNLDAPLKNLIEMELIEKRTCINSEKNKKNRIYYSICDNFFNFYFRYIFKHISELNSIGARKFFKFIQQDFEQQYVPALFEKICYQFIKYKNINTEMFNFINIGSYYFDDPILKKSGQIDLVGVSIDKVYTFIEIKYTNKPINSDILMHLYQNVKNLNINNYSLGFISKNGFSEDAKEIIKKNNWLFFDINDILNIANTNKSYRFKIKIK